jgi:hypothetical protein
MKPEKRFTEISLICIARFLGDWLLGWWFSLVLSARLISFWIALLYRCSPRYINIFRLCWWGVMYILFTYHGNSVKMDLSAIPTLQQQVCVS